MSRFSLGSDNHSGVHPLIWQALAEANVGHAPSYGTDEVTEQAMREFKTQFGSGVEAFFVFNGTAANVLCLRSLIESYEAVLCAETAHLHLDECGAPENAIGCKVLTVPTTDGKITPEQIEPFLIRGGDQHYAQPRIVSVTQCTEYGTCYSLAELRELREFTRKRNLLLHLDGARLVQAAAYLNCTLRELTADLAVDAVSFGGTKNGLLYGEAVLVFNEAAARKLKYLRKQYMQLPSKMRFLAAQFLTFFKDDLWRTIARETHDVAAYLETRLRDIPEMAVTQAVQANSVFARLPKDWVKPLRDHVFFYVWDESPGYLHNGQPTFEVRLMVSFDVKKADIDDFIECIQKIRGRAAGEAMT